MKKWMIIAFVIGLLLFLIGRAAYIRWGNANNEKKGYAKNLDFHFSATVDSLRIFSRSNGLVYFHITAGEHDLSKEDEVNKKLKFNAAVRFILNTSGKLAFHSRDLEKYHRGDSLVINSALDKIMIYRQGKRTSESAISKALSGRFF